MSRDGAGTLLVNDGTVLVANGPATLANTDRFVAAGYGSDDVITLDETNGPLVSAELQGGDGNDTLTAGSGTDRLFGDAGNDVLFGRGGDDELSGGDGDDEVNGGSGADALFDGLGDDVLRGGDGDDTLFVGEGRSDQLFGEAGNDRLTYFSSVLSSGARGVLDGGTGDDILAYYLSQPDSLDLATLIGGDGYDRIKTEAGPGGYLTIDAGGDADLVEIVILKTDYEIALGTGSDVLRISGPLQMSSPAIVVSDFAAGDSGDALDVIAVLARSLYNWDFADNPFATGFLRVEQRGGDAVIQVNVGASGDGGFQDFIVLENVSVGALTARNLGGYAANGSQTAGVTIEGTATPDFVSGTSGNDILRGFDGDDGLFGGAGADILRGGAGDDTLDGQLGDDIVHGGTGNDTIRDAFDGNDELYGGDGEDFIFTDRQWVPGSQHLLLDGGAGNDELHFLSAPGRHDATLFGGSGNDTISVYLGRNVTIDAGEGSDYVILDVGIANSVVTLGAGSDDLQLNYSGAPIVAFTVTDFEAGDGGDKFTLWPVMQVFVGGWDIADNPFTAGYLRVARQGTDAVLLHSADGDGHDYIVLGRLTGVDPGQLTAFNFGFAFGAVAIAGTSGNDTLAGTGAVDEMIGLAGNDTLIGGLGADALFGGLGMDTASYAGDDGAIFVNLTLGRGYANASFGDTYSSIENVIGTGYDDFLIGDPGVNRLDGAAGNDTIIGAVGADALIGGAGLDWASYEDNSGTVFVNLTLKQGWNNAAHGDSYEGIENLIGGLMDDFFIGDEQGNRLNGAMGADTLLGAGGADVFMFTYAPGATSTWGNPNVDLILDFTTGVDTIELAASAFAGLAPGALPASAFELGTAAADANDRIIYDQATGKLWFDADGNGAGAAVHFATLGETTHPAIAASGFVVV